MCDFVSILTLEHQGVEITPLVRDAVRVSYFSKASLQKNHWVFRLLAHEGGHQALHERESSLVVDLQCVTILEN